MAVIPTDNPVFEIVETDSNKESIKLLLVRKVKDIALPIENIINKDITIKVSLKALSDNNGNFCLEDWSDLLILYFSISFLNCGEVDEIDAEIFSPSVSECDNKFVFWANFLKIYRNLVILIPPAVENAVPPTSIKIISNIFPPSDSSTRFKNWKPVVVEALIAWNTKDSHPTSDTLDSIIINITMNIDIKIQ